MQKVELCYWWEYGDEKTRINYLSKKHSLMPWGLRVPIWKINFCSSVLWLFELPWCKERQRTAICCLEWLGRLKCLTTGLRPCYFFPRRGVLGIGHLVVFLKQSEQAGWAVFWTFSISFQWDWVNKFASSVFDCLREGDFFFLSFSFSLLFFFLSRRTASQISHWDIRFFP